MSRKAVLSRAPPWASAFISTRIAQRTSQPHN
ncbi:hypothetical protein J5H83_06825 [Pseudomonas otitidis]|nr:hypothetical protein [Pseudomonas otitidis]